MSFNLDEVKAALARRRELMETNDVPRIGETHQNLGCLAEVVLKHLTPVETDLMGLSSKLKGPSAEVFLSPLDDYEKKICLKPFDPKDVQELTHQKIIKIGTTVEEKYEKEMHSRVETILDKAKEEQRYVWCKRIKWVMESEQVKHEDELQNLTLRLTDEMKHLRRIFEREFEEKAIEHREYLEKKFAIDLEERVKEEIAKLPKVIDYSALLDDEIRKNDEMHEEKLENVIEYIKSEDLKFIKHVWAQCMETVDREITQLLTNHMVEILHIICAEKNECNSKVRAIREEFDEMKSQLSEVQEELAEYVRTANCKRCGSHTEIEKKWHKKCMEILKAYEHFANYCMVSLNNEGPAEYMVQINEMIKSKTNMCGKKKSSEPIKMCSNDSIFSHSSDEHLHHCNLKDSYYFIGMPKEMNRTSSTEDNICNCRQPFLIPGCDPPTPPEKASSCSLTSIEFNGQTYGNLKRYVTAPPNNSDDWVEISDTETSKSEKQLIGLKKSTEEIKKTYALKSHSIEDDNSNKMVLFEIFKTLDLRQLTGQILKTLNNSGKTIKGSSVHDIIHDCIEKHLKAMIMSNLPLDIINSYLHVKSIDQSTLLATKDSMDVIKVPVVSNTSEIYIKPVHTSKIIECSDSFDTLRMRNLWHQARQHFGDPTGDHEYDPNMMCTPKYMRDLPDQKNQRYGWILPTLDNWKSLEDKIKKSIEEIPISQVNVPDEVEEAFLDNFDVIKEEALKPPSRRSTKDTKIPKFSESQYAGILKKIGISSMWSLLQLLQDNPQMAQTFRFNITDHNNTRYTE